jgi:hypothetical protein
MSEFDQLSLVAEIAAALLGFIAVFIALSGTDGRFAESDRHFIQAMVMTAALAIVLALVPRALALFVPEAEVWRTAAMGGLVFGSVAMVLQARQQFAMSRKEAAKIHWLWHTVAWLLAGLSAVMLIMALVDSASASAYFVAGVTVMVMLSLTVFIAVVFRRFF